MDIGLALDKIRPNAKYRRYDTYENLVATWEDTTVCPTEQELLDAWNLIQNPVLTIDEKAALIEAKYKPKLDDYKELILSTIAVDGSTQATKTAYFQSKYNDLLAQQNAELEALYI